MAGDREPASGVEHALNAALASIDAIYAIEHVNAYNADVASPVEVQEFWEKHGALPGFAAGTWPLLVAHCGPPGRSSETRSMRPRWRPPI